MRDPRNAHLARTIIRYSTRLERGEAILIDAVDSAEGLVHELIDAAFEVGGRPLVHLRKQAMHRRWLMRADERLVALQAEIEMFRMRKVQAYVGLQGPDNVHEMADVPPEQKSRYGRLLGQPVHADYRVNHTRWVVIRYPTAAMAQLGNMSTEQFESFFYQVCGLDYGLMAEAVAPLVERMRRTDQVHIIGPGTDLRFSLAGIDAVSFSGRRNLPDGECYSAPVRDSVEGTIAYNAPSLYRGTTFTDVRFTFEGGRIVKAEGTPKEGLEALLDSDEGARYIGEFSLAFNPYMLHPIKDVLFDEKIAGSLHLTPGQAYALADNGNRSQIHWDLVLIQRPEYGGGEVWFDGERIRKDGRFVVPELEGLNPGPLTRGAATR